MKIHKHTIVTLVAAILLFWTHLASAGQPVVEIIALPHWPVQEALKPVHEALARFGDRIHVIELNADEPDGKKRLKSVGQRGHVPALILIDGMYQYTRPNGTTVDFINFPAAANSPMGLSGTWTANDVEAALLGRLNQQ